MADKDMNRKSRMEKAEGSRDTIEQDINEEYPRDNKGEGISNRPIDEERQNQDRVPDRGATKDQTSR